MGKREWKSFGSAVLLSAVVLFTQMTWAGPICIGSINREDPAGEMKKFLPLARYLAEKLKDEGIGEGKVVVARSIPELAGLLRDGKADLFIDSPYPSVAVSHLSESKFLLRRWKKGNGEYHSIIFTRKDSDMESLRDLRGKTIAFEDPYSSTGYFFPKMALVQQGLKVVPKTDPEHPATSDEVGYVFASFGENILTWVLKGRVSAGAMDHQDYEEAVSENPEGLKVIHKGPSLPRHIVSYRADLSPRLVSRIKEILLGMNQSDEGKRVLEQFERTTRFDELSQENILPLQEAIPLIDAELERYPE